VTKSTGYDAIVIGAGANGLVAAATLGRAGRRVLVVDSAGMIGGRSRALEFAPGFSAAPLSIDAGWLPPQVARAIGVSPPAAHEPEYTTTVALSDGGWLALPRSRTRAAEALRPHSLRDAAHWGEFTAHVRKFVAFLETLYLQSPPDVDAATPGELGRLLGLARSYRALGRADMIELLRVLPMSMQDWVDDEFESVAIKAAVGAGGVRDLRQGPRSGGTVYNLLHYLTGAPNGSVRARAWWRDGPDAFSNVAAEAAKAAGVTIRRDARAVRILVREDAVAGVLLDDAEEVFAPVVLSTTDPARTLLGLVDPVWLDPEFIHAVRNIKFRGCTAFVLYGLDKQPDIPGLDGIVSLSASLDKLERAYDAAKYGLVSEPPHVELTAQSLRWPGLAPEGKHVLVARVQYAPYRSRGGEPWDAGRTARLAESVTKTIADAVPAFADSVLHRQVLTPDDIETTFGFTEGAVTHGELTLDQILFMRPVAGAHRYAMPIDGLYLGGAGAHPGPGVLGGAGLLAAKRVLGR